MEQIEWISNALYRVKETTSKIQFCVLHNIFKKAKL